MLDRDDPGIAGDPESFVFELLFSGIFPRAHALYIVPEGRALIIRPGNLVGRSDTVAVRNLLLEIGDPLLDGKFIVLEPLWKCRMILNARFDWGLSESPSEHWQLSK